MGPSGDGKRDVKAWSLCLCSVTKLENWRRQKYVLFIDGVMSHSRKGGDLWTKKRRSFVYNASSVQDKRRHSNMQLIPRNHLREAASNSSHEERSFGDDEAILAQLCEDLPATAFDDDEVEIDDYFDDGVLTAEQLDEVDRLSSLEFGVVDKTANQDLKNKKQIVNTKSYSSDNIPCNYNDNQDINTKTEEQPTQIVFLKPEQQTVSSVTGSHFRSVNGDEQIPCVNSLQHQLAELTTDLAAAKAKIKLLEEEKFSKDGELRILRDSLEHFQHEEKRLQEHLRNIQQKQVREQSDREKELEKQVNSLNTRLQFKEREVVQTLEQNKKLSLTNQSPPKRKQSTSFAGDSFPTTGNSFFHQESPDKKKCTRLINFSPTSNSERQLPNSSSSYKSKSAPASAVVNQKDICAFNLEKKVMKIELETKSGINVAGKLLCLENAETTNFTGLYKTTSSSSSSVVSLLRENQEFGENYFSLQRGSESDILNCETLKLFESQISSVKTQLSSMCNSSQVEETDSLVALQSLERLVNLCHSYWDSSQHSYFLDLNKKDEPLGIREETLVVQFLPVLESFLTRFLSYNFDESNNDFCNETLSTQNESSGVIDDSTVEHFKKRLRMVESAKITLRVLNVLCLCSCSVQSVIMLGGKEPSSFSESKCGLHEVSSKVKIGNGKSRTIHSEKPDVHSSTMTRYNLGYYVSSQKNDLLKLLLRLAVPQQSECLAVAHCALKVLFSLASNCSPLLLPRLQQLLSENLLCQCLNKDFSLPTISLVVDLLTALVPQNGVAKKLCSQTDDCILLKIYQTLGLTSDTFDHAEQRKVHLKIVQFINNLLTTDEEAMHFLLDAECPCSLELVKNLVVMLHGEVNELSKLPVSSLQNAEASPSPTLQLVRQGVFTLVNLCLNDRVSDDHRYGGETEHQYVQLMYKLARLYKSISNILSEIEVLAFQDLVDLDRFEDIEWSQESEDEDACEGMDVDN